jgi:hypothetical protein
MDGTRVYLRVFALFVLLYVSSYYLLVQKQQVSDIQIIWARVWQHFDPVNAAAQGISAEAEPAYQWGESTAEFVFRPIHWLDRRIRKEYWNEPEIYPYNQAFDEALRESKK